MKRSNRPAIVATPHPHSNQLFLLFTGNAERLMIDPLRFLQVTAIADHNIMLVRDPFRAAYRCGITDGHSDIEDVVELVREEVEARFPDIVRLFCIGTSSGGLPAIRCGLALNAEVVWCFGGRVARAGAVAARDTEFARIVRELVGKDVTAGSIEQTLTLREQYIIQVGLRREDIRRRLWSVAESPAAVIDDQMLAELVGATQDQQGRMALHLYYSPANAADKHVAEAFRHVRGVALYPLPAVPQGGSMTAAEGSHFVVNILDRMGALGDIFKPYV